MNTDLVVFFGNGSDDGNIVRYLWRSSDDGEIYNGSNHNFNYTGLSNGLHIIYLKIQDNYGAWSEEVNTTLIIHERPVAVIDSISPNPGIDNETIHFMGNGTDDGTI